MRAAVVACLAAVALLALAACGGSGNGGQSEDPASQVTTAGGVQARVRAAQDPLPSEFPKPGGRSLQELADSIGGGTEMGMASSVFLANQTNRLAFGVIDKQAGFAYGKTAVYIARTPGAKALGPYMAPADVLITDPPFRSKQAATEVDPFAAIYAAQVPFAKAGKWSVMAVTLVDGKPVAAPAQVDVVTRRQDRVPEVGEMAPKVETETVASARGNLGLIDTRQPPTRELAEKSLADVLGKKPVALLFATPQLCSSRVCGPVVDEALQLKVRYGDRIQFIHQEVYVGNDPNKGLREPLVKYGLATEPWLFVIDKQGRITARLEGSFGLKAFEAALQTALKPSG
jgi:hypothetical protein